MTKLGLNTNAFTSNDMTVYHLYGPSKALPTIIDYESDRFQHLDYTEEQFKTEAGAILGEYAKSASNPDMILEEKIGETAYTKHTYRHTTIGYLDDVKAMPSGFAYSREFFRRYYTPDNATVIVAGDFDKAETLAHLTKAYSGWKGKLDAAKIPVEPPQTAPRSAHVDWKTPTLPRLFLGWHTPGASDLQAAAAQTVLVAYLFGPTSALHSDLVLGRQLVDDFDDSWERTRDPFLFGVVARVKNPADVDTVQKGDRRRDRQARRRRRRQDAPRSGALEPEVRRHHAPRHRRPRRGHAGDDGGADRRARRAQQALRAHRQAHAGRALRVRQEVADRRQPHHRHAHHRR